VVELKEEKARKADSRSFYSESGLFKSVRVHLATSESAAKVRSVSFQVVGRKPIKEFTQTSRDRLRFKIRNSHCVWTCLTTLTYPKRSPKDVRTVKKHLNAFLTALRRDYPGVRYMWWLEFQERGAPHMNLITTCPFPESTYIKRLWYKIVGSKNKKHLEFGAKVKCFYGKMSGSEIAEKYATKMDQKKKPAGYSNVGRFWGCSHNLTEPAVVLSGLSEASANRVRGKAKEAAEACEESTLAIWSGEGPTRQV